MRGQDSSSTVYGNVVKMRWGVVFGGNFGSGAGIILRLVFLWLIRHSKGQGAEEYAWTRYLS